jgi:solute carrier family 25 uncoupling protein 8/9
MMLQGEEKKIVERAGEVYKSRYKNFFDCLKVVYKEEGTKSLFRGIMAGVQRQIIYAGLRLGLYPIMAQFVNNGEKDVMKISLIRKIIAALMTGVIATCAASPTDVVKIRMQADGRKKPEDRRYKGSVHAYQRIILEEG